MGLSSLLAASHAGYDVLRIAGASYLICLGITSIRRHRDPDSANPEQQLTAKPGTQAQIRPRRAYANGVISNLCNPKIGAFFVTFLPGFIHAGASVSTYSFLFGVWFAVETGIWLALMVWVIGRGTSWVTNPRIQRHLERLSGVVLIGFGIRLATEAR
jgi:threonine/homoserine/homoserine lactone efflux protein